MSASIFRDRLEGAAANVMHIYVKLDFKGSQPIITS